MRPNRISSVASIYFSFHSIRLYVNSVLGFILAAAAVRVNKRSSCCSYVVRMNIEHTSEQKERSNTKSLAKRKTKQIMLQIYYWNVIKTHKVMYAFCAISFFVSLILFSLSCLFGVLFLVRFCCCCLSNFMAFGRKTQDGIEESGTHAAMKNAFAVRDFAKLYESDALCR